MHLQVFPVCPFSRGRIAIQDIGPLLHDQLTLEACLAAGPGGWQNGISVARWIHAFESFFKELCGVDPAEFPALVKEPVLFGTHRERSK